MKNYQPLVIFGDHFSAYGAIRDIGPHGIPIYIVSRSGKGLSTKSRYVRKTLVLEKDETNFSEKLNTWLAKEVGNTGVLMVAGDDDYLDVLARNYGKLPTGFKPTFPDWEIVKLVREKRRTYKIAEEIDVPIPKTTYIRSQDELEDVLNSEMGKNYPLLMKAEKDSAILRSRYRIKGLLCNNEDEVLENYKKYDGFGGSLLLQEMIPGGEENLFCLKTVLNKNSEPLALFVDKKLRSGKQFWACTLTTSTWADEVVDYGLKLVKKIGYFGYASIEFKFDHRDKKFKLMEINGRVSKNVSHALRCGIRLPYLMYQEAVNGNLPPLSELKQTHKNNILWWDPIGDLGSIYYSIKNRTFNPIKYFTDMIGKGYIIEPMNRRDPYPGLYSTTLISNYFKRQLTQFFSKNRK